MPSTRIRAASLLTGCIALGSLNGCVLASFIAICEDGDTACLSYFYANGGRYPNNGTPTSDANGCVTAVALPGCSDAGTTYCGLQPNTLYSARSLCDDPILAEWPDAWTVTSATWARAFPPPIGGAVIIEDPANFSLPEGVGPIVTDPGYSAHVLRLDVEELPVDTYVIRIEFDRGDLPSACAKGIEVSMTTFEPGNVRFISPLPGESLDLTTYSAPDPHVVCVDAPSPVLPSTWGWIKGMYR